MRRVIILLLFPIAAQAALECKGKAFGLDSIYTFETAENNDLSVNSRTFMDGKIFIESSGTAKHSSTVKDDGLGVSESYYIYVPEKDSYTEVIAISRNLKTMARSRPMPESETGNFIKFSCSGTL
jgi:hypothetical protein